MEFETFSFEDKKIEFDEITGTVLNQNKFSETHISSRGNVNSVTSVSSNVLTRHEVWLKNEHGQEASVDLSGSDVPIRDGQNITVLHLKTESQGAAPLLLVNHVSGRYHFLNDEITLLEKMGYRYSNYWWITIPLALASCTVGCNSAMESNSGGGIAFFGFIFPVCAFVIGAALKKDRIKKLKSEFTKHREVIVNQVFEMGENKGLNIIKD